MRPFSQMNACGVGLPSAAVADVSLHPTTWLRSLIATASLDLPPSVPRSVIRPFSQMNACSGPLPVLPVDRAPADDLAALIDGGRLALLATERAEIDHRSVPPGESVIHVPLGGLVDDATDDLAAFADRDRVAVPRAERVQLAPIPVLPQERLHPLPQARGANDLAPVINGSRVTLPTRRNQIKHPPGAPQERVTVSGRGVATTDDPATLADVADAVVISNRVASQRAQIGDHPPRLRRRRRTRSDRRKSEREDGQRHQSAQTHLHRQRGFSSRVVTSESKERSPPTHSSPHSTDMNIREIADCSARTDRRGWHLARRFVAASISGAT